MKDEILKKITDFFTTAKELNYDLAAIYAKDPMAIQIIGATLLVLLILIVMIKKSLNRSSAMKTLHKMSSDEYSFDEYQSYMNKIVKILPSAKEEFLEIFENNKENYYTTQLSKLQDMEISQKIQRYQEISKTYSSIGRAVSNNEELSKFYEDKSNELISDKLHNEITSYIKDLNFSEDTISEIESIVAYANMLEEPQHILDDLTERLQSVDFGSSLDIFMFVRSLDSEKLAQIYEYCTKKQDELFEDENIKISSDILDYLLQNGEKDKVYSYVKTLQLATYLQELSYKYFNQNDNFEFDLVFISNPTPITSQYKEYLEAKITDNWKDDNYIEALIKNENVITVIGHDRARLVIERVEDLRKVYDEKQILDEALKTANEAKALALEAKELVQAQTTITKDEEEPQHLNN